MSGNQSAQRQADLVSQAGRAIRVSQSWLGPIPPPADLRQYEEVAPGSAERILTMAEKQLEHRHRLESTIVGGNSKRSYLGLAAGFVLSAMIIGGGIYLISNGHDWAGASLIGINVVGLAGVFVYGSRSRQAELDKVASIMLRRRNQGEFGDPARGIDRTEQDVRA